MSSSISNLSLTILVPAYNEEKNIYNILQDIVNQDIPIDWTCHVVIIPNGCSDGTEEIARRFVSNQNSLNSPNVTWHIETLVANQKGMALNAGLKNSYNSPVVINVDADCRLEKDTLATIARSLYQDTSLAVVGALDVPDLQELDPNTLLFQFLRVQQIAREERGRFRPVGRCVGYKPHMLNSRFPEDIHSEDIWLALRSAQLYGWQSVKVLMDTKVWFNPPLNWHDYLLQETRHLIGIPQLLEKHPELIAAYESRQKIPESEWPAINRRILARLKEESIPLNRYEECISGIWDNIITENAMLCRYALIDNEGRWFPVISTK